MNQRFLVPLPKMVETVDGFHLLSDASVFAAPEEFRETVLTAAQKYWHITPQFEAVEKNSSNDGKYSVSITETRIDFKVASRSELTGALKTLRQWAEAERNQLTSSRWILECGSFADEPGLEFRGIHICYFRETDEFQLEKMIRMAAFYKFNYVVIEFWGTFPFKKYPQFQWQEKHGNREFIRHLVELSKELDITLIPQYNCFGHAPGSSISNGWHVVLDRCPEFAPLFEPDGWTWCLSNPHTRTVLKDMIEEIFELFGDVPYFHLGFDEAFNADTCIQCRKSDYPQLLLEHILFLRDILAQHGSRAILWHDMFLELDEEKWGKNIILDRNTPNPHEILEKLPRDIMLADWHYNEPEADKNGVFWPTADHFAERGFQVLLCPWFRANGIMTMAEQATDHKLTGLLETTWASVSGTSRWHKIFFISSNKMWNRDWKPEIGFADEFNVVNTHTRYIAQDMNANAREQFGTIYTGYSFFS